MPTYDSPQLYSTAISICPANGTNKINIPNTYTLPQYESTAVSDGACTVFYPVKLPYARTIITRGLYIFYPIFEDQKCLFKELFS